MAGADYYANSATRKRPVISLFTEPTGAVPDHQASLITSMSISLFWRAIMSHSLLLPLPVVAGKLRSQTAPPRFRNFYFLFVYAFLYTSFIKRGIFMSSLRD